MINPPWWKTSFVFFIILYFKRGICHSMSDQKQNVKFPSAGVETVKSGLYPDAKSARNNSRFHVGPNFYVTALSFDSEPIYATVHILELNLFAANSSYFSPCFWLLSSKLCFFLLLPPPHASPEKKQMFHMKLFCFFKIRYLRKSQQAEKSLFGLLSSLLFRIKQISENKHVSLNYIFAYQNPIQAAKINTRAKSL